MKKTTKLLLLFLSLTLISNNLFAQSVTWGDEVKEDKNEYPVGVIGEDDEGFFVHGKKTKRTGLLGYSVTNILSKYDSKDMSLIFQKKIDIPNIDGIEVSIDNIIYIDDQFILFTSTYNKKEKLTKAFAQRLSKDGVVDLDYVELTGVKGKNRRNTGSVDVTVSDDKKTFLIYENPPFKKYANEKFGYKVYNKDLEILWEKEIELPLKDINFGIKDYFVDNETNVFMLANIYPTKEESKASKKKDREKPLTKKVILAYNNESGTLSQYELDLGKDKFATDISYFIENGLLKICGFYSDDLKRYSAVGVFYLTINIDSKVVETKSFQPFKKEFIAGFIGERKAGKGRGLNNFDIKNILSNEDGGFTFIAEYYRYYQVCTTNANGQRTCTYHYLYNDIIVANIDSKGIVDWVERVPKLQHTTNDGGYYSSYIVGVNNGNINIVFNDSPKNLAILKADPNASRIKNMAKAKKSVSVLVTVTPNGDVTRELLFTNKQSKTILRPKLHRQLAEDEIIVYATRGKLYKFGKLKF